jgi:hypothetical protein
MREITLVAATVLALVRIPTTAAAAPCIPQYEWQGAARLSHLALVTAQQGYLATWIDGDRERYVAWSRQLDRRLASGERATLSEYGRTWRAWVGGDSDVLRLAAFGNSVELERLDLTSVAPIDAVTLDTGSWVNSVTAAFDGTGYVVAAASQYGSVGEFIDLWYFDATGLAAPVAHHRLVNESLGDVALFARTVGESTWIVWGSLSQPTVGIRMSNGQLLDDEPRLLHEQGPTEFATRGDEGAVFIGRDRVLLDPDGPIAVVSQAPPIGGEIIGTESGYAVARDGFVWDFDDGPGHSTAVVLISANTYETTELQVLADEHALAADGDGFVVLSLTDDVYGDSGTRTLQVRRLSLDGTLAPIAGEDEPLQVVDYARQWIEVCPEPPPSSGGGLGSSQPPPWPFTEGEGCQVGSGSGGLSVALALLLLVWGRRRRGGRAHRE